MELLVCPKDPCVSSSARSVFLYYPQLCMEPQALFALYLSYTDHSILISS